ncbi:hypothetical protein OUZ56_015593 [Daphnia magna]|uniref:BTB domain-containing protein n=1 Tax=Daphnia magna TaxID=35525 RepID=A0ABR0AN87_9CRUS|nr:hypothetical protein OUZ56_015593 [Daphnia magna]
MLLKENEFVFRDYEWLSTSGDAKVPNTNIKVVSPFFSVESETCEISDGHKTFRFGIRLVGNGTIFDKFHTVVYFYAHNVDVLGIDVAAVECSIGLKTATQQSIYLQRKFKESQVIQVFKSEEFLTYDHLSDKGISLKYRIYMANNKYSNIRLGLRFELRDTTFSQELWSAAQKGHMTDCEFVVKNQIFLAHRVVVAARCPVLAERMGSDGNTGTTNSVAFKALLYFLYTGHLLPGMNSYDRQQFTDLVKQFQVKTAAESMAVINRSKGMSQLFLAIQPNLKSRDQLTVEIRENHGRVSLTGRGLCLHYDYITTFRAGDVIAPEMFRFDREGFFGVTLTESQHKNGHNYQLTFSSFHLVSGFKLVAVTYDLKDGARSSSLPTHHCNMTKMYEEGGCNETLKIFREGISLPKNVENNSLCTVHVNFKVYLAEVDECWGYRLNDPRLPVEFWSAVKHKIFTDVELHVGSRSFSVHRAILSARSSVFAAMFKNIDMVESDSSLPTEDDCRSLVIDICAGEENDLDPDAFEDFLVFLYTGRLRTTESLAELWAAANKYDVKTLERISESAKVRFGMEELCVALMSNL